MRMEESDAEKFCDNNCTWSDHAPGCIRSIDIPVGYKLLKDTTFEERSFQEDYSLENGNYFNVCSYCRRTFSGHKRRGLCKVCA